MGFGHRVYKNYDPRAKIIKRQLADQVFEVTGSEPAARHRPGARKNRPGGRLLRQAQALPQRRLLLRHHLPGDGLPIPRTSGWLAQWEEMLEDSEQKIARPRQIYLGSEKRPYIPMSDRA